MKLTSVTYSLLLVLSVAAVLVISWTVTHSGSESAPFWTAAASPGALSAAHGFLDTQCEACHTPTRGVEEASCLSCHVTAAPELVTKPSTAFHNDIGECAGCHVEHQGRDRRPINMDHAVLAATGHARAAKAGASGRQPGEAGFSHALARLRILLDSSIGDLRASLIPRSLSPTASAQLDCVSCHVNQDPHRTLFGSDCQTCHAVDVWTVAEFQHPSPRSQDCVQCHQAPPSHYMMHFEMMDRTISGQENARVEQCFLCHQTDAWNNVRGVGWRELH